MWFIFRKCSGTQFVNSNNLLCRKYLDNYNNGVPNNRRNIYNILKHCLHTSNIDYTFWEKDPKGGYDTKSKIKVPMTTHLRDGCKELKKELVLLKSEIKEKLECDPLLAFRPGEIDVTWKLNSKDSLNKWVVTSDSDHNEGDSKATLELSKSGFALFSGTVSTRVPKDGRTKKSGYCNIKSIRAQKSFKREAYLNWTPYTTLVMRVRGDGRPYLINIAAGGYFDILWNDVYHYVLYTRGGPYWQSVKIPFSKFFLASKGRVQDRQGRVPLDRVTGIGFSVGPQGSGDGEFQLEIDYIGVEFQPAHLEDFAYEMYKTQKYIVAT